MNAEKKTYTCCELTTSFKKYKEKNLESWGLSFYTATEIVLKAVFSFDEKGNIIPGVGLCDECRSWYREQESEQLPLLRAKHKKEKEHWEKIDSLLFSLDKNK